MIQDLHPSEADLLQEYFHLHRVWGYRQGINGTHLEYEEASSYCLWVQPFSDLLFRNLQQLSAGGMSNLFYGSDFLAKIDQIMNQDKTVVTDAGCNLIARYLNEPYVLDKMEALYSMDVTNGTSKMFVCLVLGARAIVLLGERKYDDATEIIGTLKEIVSNRLKLD